MLAAGAERVAIASTTAPVRTFVRNQRSLPAGGRGRLQAGAAWAISSISVGAPASQNTRPAGSWQVRMVSSAA